jgi:hypothetical protein
MLATGRSPIRWPGFRRPRATHREILAPDVLVLLTILPETLAVTVYAPPIGVERRVLHCESAAQLATNVVGTGGSVP